MPQLAAAIAIPRGWTETFPPLPGVASPAKSKQLLHKNTASNKPDHQLTIAQLERRMKSRKDWGTKVNKLGLHYDDDELYRNLSDNQKKQYAEYISLEETVESPDEGTEAEREVKMAAQEKLDQRQDEFESWAKKEWVEEAGRLSIIRECFDTCMEGLIAFSEDETQPKEKREAAQEKIKALETVWDEGNFAMPAWGPSEKASKSVGLVRLPVPAGKKKNAGQQKKPIQVDSDRGMG